MNCRFYSCFIPRTLSIVFQRILNFRTFTVRRVSFPALWVAALFIFLISLASVSITTVQPEDMEHV